MWVHSFISHSKKVFLFLAVIIGITSLMNYLYVDDTDEFARYMLHDFYEQKENIDRIYLGSSHVFCDIDPLILDEINEDNNYNLATGNQQLIGSYYLLREADKKHDISHAYIDLYYACMTEGIGNIHDYNELPRSWLILNQMKPSINKFSYMVNLSEPRYYYLSFLPFIRYKEQLFQMDYVAGIMNAKRTETWKNYQYYHIREREGEQFVVKNAEKGFISNYATPESGRFYEEMPEMPLKEEPITEEVLEYFVKIIDYCEVRDIALTWIGCPISDFQLVGNGGYDNYVDQLKELSVQYDIPYYDFNLCKKEYLDLSSDQYWSDKGHLNTVGAKVFTQFLGEFLKAEENGDTIYADCFHDSYEEKISAAEEDIFGIEIVVSDEYEKFLSSIEPERWEEYVIYKIHPITNAEEGNVEIHVCQIPRREENESDFGRKDYTAEEEMKVVLEGNDGYAIVGIEEQGSLYIETKLKGALETKNWAEIELN